MFWSKRILEINRINIISKWLSPKLLYFFSFSFLLLPTSPTPTPHVAQKLETVSLAQLLIATFSMTLFPFTGPLLSSSKRIWSGQAWTMSLTFTPIPTKQSLPTAHWQLLYQPLISAMTISQSSRSVQSSNQLWWREQPWWLSSSTPTTTVSTMCWCTSSPFRATSTIRRRPIC